MVFGTPFLSSCLSLCVIYLCTVLVGSFITAVVLRCILIAPALWRPISNSSSNPDIHTSLLTMIKHRIDK